ncbi:MAG: TIM barrel protein [Fimbriimonadia bacterium]
MSSSLPIAIQPITWGNTPLEQVCQEVATLGYEGIEPPVANYLEDIPRLHGMLEEAGLRCSATYTGVSLLDPATREEELRQELAIARALRELDAEIIVLSAPERQVERSVSHPPSVIREYAGHVNDLCRRLREETGVIPAFHNHIHTLIERPEEIDLFLEYTDPDLLFCGFDSAQLSAGGACPVEYFIRYAARTRYVHLKDRQLGRPTYGNFCELGLGFIDIQAIVQVLTDAGYSGWLTVEVDQSLTTPRDSAAVCREFLCNRCGL